MDALFQRDQAARDRVRQAQEFLDPRNAHPASELEV
jgi:hypothetical protein